MLFRVTVFILCAAIVVFFAEDFKKSIKRIFAIKGAQLFLPLIAASFFVNYFSFWVLWILYYIKECLVLILKLLMMTLSKSFYALALYEIFLLTLLAVIPVFLLNHFSYKRNFKRYPYTHVTSLFILILSALILFSS